MFVLINFIKVDDKDTKKKDQKKNLVGTQKQELVKGGKNVPQPKGKGKVFESSSDDDSDDSEDDKKKPVVGQKRPRATSATSEQKG